MECENGQKIRIYQNARLAAINLGFPKLTFLCELTNDQSEGKNLRLWVMNAVSACVWHLAWKIASVMWYLVGHTKQQAGPLLINNISAELGNLFQWKAVLVCGVNLELVQPEKFNFAFCETEKRSVLRNYSCDELTIDISMTLSGVFGVRCIYPVAHFGLVTWACWVAERKFDIFIDI